jgi:hypothetical protein
VRSFFVPVRRRDDDDDDDDDDDGDRGDDGDDGGSTTHSRRRRRYWSRDDDDNERARLIAREVGSAMEGALVARLVEGCLSLLHEGGGRGPGATTTGRNGNDAATLHLEALRTLRALMDGVLFRRSLPACVVEAVVPVVGVFVLAQRGDGEFGRVDRATSGNDARRRRIRRRRRSSTTSSRDDDDGGGGGGGRRRGRLSHGRRRGAPTATAVDGIALTEQRGRRGSVCK